MIAKTAVPMLAALAHESRLAAFRLLVQQGEEGLCVGDLQTRLGIPLTTLSFHLKELSQVGLIKSRQLGRFIYYGPNFALMASLLDFLTEKCCANSSGPRACAISEARETLAKGATRRARKQEVV